MREMMNDECRMMSVIATLLALAALVLSCAGPAGEDGKDGTDGSDLSDGSDDDSSDDDADDDLDDDAADDDADDDDAPNCAIVWAECEYEFPEDLDPTDECGESIIEPTTPDDEQWDAYFVQFGCEYGIQRDRAASISECGFSGGCNQDWNYAYWVCRTDLNNALIACTQDPADWETFYDCQSSALTNITCGNV
jgi:hypothetical protein